MKGCGVVVDLSVGIKLADCTLYMAGHGETALPPEIPSAVYTFMCARNGSCVLSAAGKTVKTEKNSIAVLLPREKISLTEDGFECDIAVLSVDSKRYRDVFSLLDSERQELSSRVFFDENIESVIGNLCREIDSQSMAYSAELLSLMCSQLVVYSIRHFGLAMSGNVNNNVVNVRICTQVMNYIDSHIFTMRNLREVAAAMGYNYSYTSSLFHKTTGVTLNNYFKNKRMSEAKKLLADSKMSISEIARIMNYSSVYAFSKAFKEHFGASPGHYSGRFTNK